MYSLYVRINNIEWSCESNENDGCDSNKKEDQQYVLHSWSKQKNIHPKVITKAEGIFSGMMKTENTMICVHNSFT